MMAGVAAVAMAELVAAGAARAQAAGDVGEVVVTARRRAEQLRDVPAAVTAITEADRAGKVKGLAHLALRFTSITVDDAGWHFVLTVRGSKWAVLRGWHVLRHSFASNLAAKGVDQRFIDEFLGHQTEAQRRRYRHLFPHQQRQVLCQVFGG